MTQAARQPPLGIYGTLLDPQVRALVLGVVAGRAATLAGWERVYFTGATYPGIRPRADAAIDVLVLCDLSELAVASADAFEGSDYERRVLPVRFADNGGAGQAQFYVPKAAARLTARAWRYDDGWLASHLAAFLAEAEALVAGYRSKIS